MILDVGCGNHPVKSDVTIDVRRDSKAHIIADAHNLPFRDAVFSKVFLVEVLEHLESPTKCLLEVRRVLKKGGKLNLTVPNVLVVSALLKWIFNKPIEPHKDHISAWRLAELKILLKRCSFVVLGHTFVNIHSAKLLPASFLFPRLLKKSIRLNGIKGKAS